MFKFSRWECIYRLVLKKKSATTLFLEKTFFLLDTILNIRKQVKPVFLYIHVDLETLLHIVITELKTL